MARNNIKVLTADQLKRFNQKYVFDVEDDDIIVMINGYDRITRHPKNESFEINSQTTVKRKVRFTVQAINFWLELRNSPMKPSLFDIQQAVNILTISYQKVDIDNVVRLLKKPDVKIQRIY